MNHKSLLLNADFRPFKLIEWQKALVQTICDTKDSCYAVEYYNEWVIFDSSGTEYQVPAVIALKKYVDAGSMRAAYTKKNVFIRDELTCQYCREKFPWEKLTVDHVIPRSRWAALGKKHGRVSCFENIVTACKNCNSLKADRTCQEAKMHPINPPKAVTCREIFTKGLRLQTCPPEWEPYIKDV